MSNESMEGTALGEIPHDTFDLLDVAEDCTTPDRSVRREKSVMLRTELFRIPCHMIGLRADLAARFRPCAEPDEDDEITGSA